MGPCGVMELTILPKGLKVLEPEETPDSHEVFFAQGRSSLSLYLLFLSMAG